ncbi:MAG: SAM-dependent methyltransferase [Parvicellaceae bacterium]|tara:strand:- start:8237 stop:8938 length:702 start_codon:yes stop_codon:yes gene_type:complete
MSKGILYLIPVPIHSEEDFNIKLIPPYIIELINNLKFFAVENLRTSRRFIKKLNSNFDIDNTNFFIVDKRTEKEIIREIVDRLLDGNDVGIMSESGCPGIADPGQEICELAHKHQIAIKPLIGPNSIILALMASGLNGQEFKFHGYLPIEQKDRIKEINIIQKKTGAHIFIETPYRNQKVLEDLIKQIKPQNRKISIAIDLTGKSEKIITKTVYELSNSKIILEKKPTIFIFE